MLFPAPPFGFETAITGINPLVSLFEPPSCSWLYHTSQLAAQMQHLELLRYSCGQRCHNQWCHYIAYRDACRCDIVIAQYTYVAAIYIVASLSLQYCILCFKSGVEISEQAQREGSWTGKRDGLRVQKSISAPSRPLCAANTAITAIWRQVNWRFPTSRCETEVPMPSNKKKNSPGLGCCSCNAGPRWSECPQCPCQPPYHEK